MSTITITEALAELATIAKRLPKKKEGMIPYVARLDQAKDPFSTTGGSDKFIASERHSFRDLLQRRLALRRAIATVNADTVLTVQGTTRPVGDWIVWKRENCPAEIDLLKALLNQIQGARNEARKRGAAVVAVGSESGSNDIVVSVDEQALIREIEATETLFGALDGALSLKNATTTVDV